MKLLQMLWLVVVDQLCEVGVEEACGDGEFLTNICYSLIEIPSFRELFFFSFFLFFLDFTIHINSQHHSSEFRVASPLLTENLVLVLLL